MSFLRKPRRSFRRFVSSFRKKYSSVTRSVRDAGSSLTKFSEQDVDVSRSVTRRAVTKGNYFNPLFWIVQAATFSIRYLSTRKVVPAVQGLPAIFGFVSPVLIVFWLAPSQDSVISRTRGQRDFFSESGDYEKADFYARKLCFLSPDDPYALMDRATLLDQMDREDEALAIAVQLADQRKHLPANAWICSRELQAIESEAVIDEDRDRQLVARLSAILTTRPDHEQANFMLGTFYLMRGQYTRAMGPFETVVREASQPIPEASYSLAIIHSKVGNHDAAAKHAEVAASEYLDRISTQQYSTDSTVRVLRALMMARQESEAEQFIRQLLPQRTEQEAKELNWLLGEVCAQWAKRLRSDPRHTDSDLVRAVGIIHRAVAAAPNNPIVMDELTRLACSDELQDEKLVRQLDMTIDSGVSPGLVHFIRGTRLLTRTPPDVEAAMIELDLAMAHDEAFPGLLNNVANAMMEDENADPQQALLLVEQALAQMPNQPHFLDTRGNIYLRQKQYVKAIADFERALVEDDLREVLHRRLAEAYTRLNNTSEADRHLRLAEGYARMNNGARPTPDQDDTEGPDTN